MGVERFFSSIRNEFNVTENTEYPYKKINSKYLFIDFNSIVHVLSAHQLNLYNLNNKTNINEFENELLDNIKKYLIEMFTLNLYPENLEYIYICIDGVPTMGKIYEQKKRRYMASLIKYIGEKYKLKKSGFNWDKNNISPGTIFMNKLEKYLDSDNFKDKVKNICPNLKVYKLSGTNEKGEGEMKIINIIKKNKIKDDTVVYSPDSDMVILLMMLTNNNVILRYDQQNSRLDDNFRGKMYNILQVNKFKKTLIMYINKRKNPFLNINIDRFINDVILIFTIFGDDFLPKLENFRVSNDIFTILDYYIINYQDNGYLLNDDKSIKKIALHSFFTLLSLNEYLFLQRNRMLTIYSNYNRMDKDIMGYEMFIFRDMVFELLWKFIYSNKDKYDSSTVNPHNINKFIDGKEFLEFVKNEPNINVMELGKYSKRFLKYAKGNIYNQIKDIFVNNYINILKFLKIDIFYENSKKYNSRKIMNQYHKNYYLIDSKFNFLNDILIFMYYNSLQFPFDLALIKNEPLLNKVNHDSKLLPHKNRLRGLSEKEEFLYRMEYKLDDFYNMLNPNDDFYTKHVLDKENYKNKYDDLYLNKNTIQDYLDGISWITSYYFGNNVDETWYYKYGRSPLLSHIVKYMDNNYEFRKFENKNLNLIPLTQLLFITPFNYNENLVNQMTFINYKEKNKLTDFVENNKKFYYDLQKIYQNITNGKNSDIDCSTSIFLSKCHLHFLEKNIDINEFIKVIK
jgi:5'-3' exonuclease